MRDRASRPEPSETLKANPYLMRLWTASGIASEELERRARGALRLSEAFSSIPWHAQRAAKDPDYWNSLYASRINW